MKFSRNKNQNIVSIPVKNKLYAFGVRLIRIVHHAAWIFFEKLSSIFKYARHARRDKKSLLAFIVFSSFLLSGIIFALAELGGYGQNGPAAAPNSLNYGLVGYWDMEEGSGQTVYDKSGKGKNGTLGASSSVEVSDPVFGPGHNSSGLVGTGMIFDGKDDYIDCGNDEDFGITNKFTLSAWVKPTGINPNPNAPEYGSNYVASFSDSCLRYEDSAFVFRVTNLNDINADAKSSAKELNHWYHIVGVYNGTDVRLYVDGVSAAAPVALSENVMLGNPFRIGNFSGYENTRHFNGSIDEVRIYNRVLSEDEIRLLYNQKKPVLEYKFDEGSGTVAHDASFNHNDATLGGGTTDYMPKWTTGKNGSALSFDGINDYIDAGNVSAAKSPQGSLSFWIKPASFLAGSYTAFHIYESDIADYLRSYVYSDGTINLVVEDNDVVQVGLKSTTLLAAGVWTHVSWVQDGVGIKLYLNGVPAAVTGTNSGSWWTNHLNSFNTKIGGPASPWGDFNGSLDDIRLYNYARTTDEVLADYNDGMAVHFGENDHDLNKGLVGYWDMEEGNGQTIYDKSGNGNNGVLGTSSLADSADPIFVGGHDSSGESGTGLTCDGINDHVDLGTTNSLDMGTNDRTYNIWFKNNGVFVSPNRTIINSGASSSTPASAGIWIAFNGTNSILIHFADGTTTRVLKTFDTGRSVFDDQWHSLTVIYDRDVGAFVYVDGIISPTSPLDITTQQGYVDDKYAQRLCADTNTIAYAFNGSIDEVRIYNRVLSEDEIRLLYNQKKPVLEYKFDEGSGTVAHDASFNHNDATLGGGTTDYMPKWTTGKNGSALSFDGINDYITQALSIDAGGGAVSMWLKDPATVAGGGEFIFTSNTNARTYFGLAYDSFIFTKGDPSTYIGTFIPIADTSGWHHYELTWHNAGGIFYASSYFDGVARGSEVAFSDSDVTDGTYFTLGGWGTTHEENGAGTVDNLRIYNYARTADEVLTDYNDGMAAHFGKDNQDLNKGLVGYWDMEEGSGQTIYDKSGNGNNGVLGISSSIESSDPVFGEGHDAHGKTGVGLVCDGTDDRADLGTISSLDMGTNDRTYNIWFKNNGAFSLPKRTILYSGAGSGTPASAGIWIAFDGTNSVSVHFADGTTTRVLKTFDAGKSVFDDQWHNLTVIYDRDVGAFVYVDGVISSTSPLDITTQQGYVDDKYAQRLCGVSEYTFKGIVDEVRIYNRVLSEDEIRLLYNQKKPVLEYKFDEGSGTVAHDASFNHNDATLGGGTTDYMPKWTTGKNGSALDLDGIDDYVSTTSTVLNGASAFTVSFWVKPNAFTGSYSFSADEVSNSSVTSFGTQGVSYNGYQNTFAATIESGGSRVNKVGTVARSNLPAGVWYHYVAVFDGSKPDNSGRLKIYLNGMNQALAYDGTMPTIAYDPGSSYKVKIGHCGAYSNGIIDNVRIYNYARNAEEILTDYNSGLAAHLR